MQYNFILVALQMVLNLDKLLFKYFFGPPYLDMPCAVRFVDGTIALRQDRLEGEEFVYILPLCTTT